MLEAQRIHVWAFSLGILNAGDVPRKLALGTRLQGQLVHILRDIEKFVRKLGYESRRPLDFLKDSDYYPILSVLIRRGLFIRGQTKMWRLDTDNNTPFSSLVHQIAARTDTLWASTGDIVHGDRLMRALSWLILKLEDVDVLRQIATASEASRPFITVLASMRTAELTTEDEIRPNLSAWEWCALRELHPDWWRDDNEGDDSDDDIESCDRRPEVRIGAENSPDLKLDATSGNTSLLVAANVVPIADDTRQCATPYSLHPDASKAKKAVTNGKPTAVPQAKTTDHEFDSQMSGYRLLDRDAEYERPALGHISQVFDIGAKPFYDASVKGLADMRSTEKGRIQIENGLAVGPDFHGQHLDEKDHHKGACKSPYTSLSANIDVVPTVGKLSLMQRAPVLCNPCKQKEEQARSEVQHKRNVPLTPTTEDEFSEDDTQLTQNPGGLQHDKSTNLKEGYTRRDRYNGPGKRQVLRPRSGLPLAHREAHSPSGGDDPAKGRSEDLPLPKAPDARPYVASKTIPPHYYSGHSSDVGIHDQGVREHGSTVAAPKPDEPGQAMNRITWGDRKNDHGVIYG
jgi:hypothetical protein